VRGGERVALRLLGSDRPARDLRSLGMPEAQAGLFEQALSHADGLVLVVGPTGSGKTTTLHTALESLRRPDRVIVTVEDPVERDLVAFKASTGVTVSIIGADEESFSTTASHERERHDYSWNNALDEPLLSSGRP